MGLCPTCRTSADTTLTMKMLIKRFCDKCGREYYG